MGAGGTITRVQAATVRARRTFVAEKFGGAAERRYVEAASGELRALFESRSSPKEGWVDFDLFIEANELADRLFGAGDYELCREIGRFAAGRVQGVWATFFVKRFPPSLVMRLASGMWHHHYDGGCLTTREVGSQGLVVSLSQFPRPHPTHCVSIAGWMQGTLELGPRHDISVTELACRTRGAQSCDFRLRWRG